MGGGEGNDRMTHRQGRTQYHVMMVWEKIPQVASSLRRDFMKQTSWNLSAEDGLWLENVGYGTVEELGLN